ncbi:hypothetical protein FHX82_005944 [Amycolatopsis bartoniae]|uniref:Protein-glutamine gamma-glutamyltransferase-like C-terminal domain-containing protein n=1 Tax=Amycolatopsis bartoniae TaxID=941986 RepID=A0A8H9J2S5_9PSEU|nr:DUF4129 domain-containing protein [Amycolatopsis bartoniae]MBB2938866.1 hypothetical protein [Amycolatopsis bartoniae]TVT00686.1 DUF4129 domain-containing protein [Amycolatopsis bartoniae]GHF77202.1 hypothetical protein GCM10017566_59250 [Amycolatopsis bartoniae]
MILPLRVDVPVTIDRDSAQRAAEAELSGPEYHVNDPGLVDRVLRWLAERLADLFHAASTAVPGGPLGLLVLLAVLVLIAVVVRLRVGKLARTTRVPGLVFEDTTRTAADYRQAAEQAAAAGDFAAAVRERFRALVRGLEERGVLEALSGRTVDEAARDAGARLPASRDALIAAARLFDDVHYGDRPAGADDYRRLAALDEQVQRERPGVPA